MARRQRASRALLGLTAFLSLVGVILQLLNYEQETSPKKGLFYVAVILALIASTACGILGMFQKRDQIRCVLSLVSLIAPFVLGWSLWNSHSLAKRSGVGMAYVFIVLLLTSVGALNAALTIQCGNDSKQNRLRSLKKTIEKVDKKQDTNANLIELEELPPRAQEPPAADQRSEADLESNLHGGRQRGISMFSSTASTVTLPASRCQNIVDRRQAQEVRHNMVETMDGLRELTAHDLADGQHPTARRSCPAYQYVSPPHAGNYAGVPRASSAVPVPVMQTQMNFSRPLIQHHPNVQHVMGSPSPAPSTLPPPMPQNIFNAYGVTVPPNFAVSQPLMNPMPLPHSPPVYSGARSVSRYATPAEMPGETIGMVHQPFPLRPEDVQYPEFVNKVVTSVHAQSPFVGYPEMQQPVASTSAHFYPPRSSLETYSAVYSQPEAMDTH
ncbi:hypothetical protein M3Y99_00845800 [Aphelenchoides fujianensis]|nr:hypothetical protein M3Y99_00845800 [Aphelenchoides fujianensis]